VKALRHKGSGASKRIRDRREQPLRVVTVRLSPEDVEMLDRLARVHGSRGQAVRFLLAGAAAAYLELRSELAELREEVVALRAAVERLGSTEVVTRAEGEARPGDDEAVKQVLGALLSMDRTAKLD